MHASTDRPPLHTESTAEEEEEELWDDPSAFDLMEKQISRSIRRAVAKACKHMHNSIEKRLDPHRNNKKRVGNLNCHGVPLQLFVMRI